MADNKTDKNVEVIQADRDAAASWYEGPCTEAMLISEFARHRLRHQPQEREAVLGLEWSEDGYSLRTPYDGDVNDDTGQHIVVGGETVVTFADSDEGERAREWFLAALTTPAPADGTDPEDHSGQKLRETVDQELTRIEKRNSGRDQAPAFDRELARNVILAAFGLFDCPKDTTASGYQWMRLLTLLGLDKTAPAVSTDEIVAGLTRPVISLENRTPQEVFHIMCDRIRHRLSCPQ